ncbi:MAG: hypothetical protein FJ379_06150 [Verrucomicrobia bacterium]|nr:hypothetical protein [Verrucomicrobiota bacterium]
MTTLRTLSLLVCLLSAWASWAQPVPRLDTASASWFQRGTTNRITLSGDALGNLSEVLLTGIGVTATLEELPAPAVALEGSTTGVQSEPAGAVNSRRIRLVVDPEASPTPRALRVAGPDGVSNALTLQFSDVPEVLESAVPSPLPLPVAVSGTIGANAETDRFSFAAKAGQRLILDVQANRFGSPLDPTLIIADAEGKTLARSEDAHGLDSFIDFEVPKDGTYQIALQDLRFQGAGNYRYRLLIGELPYLESLFPFGGRRGSEVTVSLQGSNLGGADTLKLRIAPDAQLGRQDLRARTDKGVSNPQGFETDDLPELLETEPNNAPGQAMRLTPPMIIDGRIGEAKDADTFRFTAPADQRLSIEVQARRFGSPLDSLLTLMDAQGAVIARNDDAAEQDARIEFDAKKDMEYLLSLRDLTDRGGARFGYRLVLRPPEQIPDFIVRASAGRIRITQGGRTALRCELDPRHGFDGMVPINAVNLPPGVSASPLVLGPQNRAGWIVLSATEVTTLGFLPFQLEAISELGGKPVSRMVQFPESPWLTVLPPAPFEVDVAQPSLLAEQNGSTSLDVSVVRRPGFTGEVRISAEDLPGVSIPAVAVPTGQSRAKLNLQVSNGSEVGIRPVLVRGEATVDGRTSIGHAAQPVPLQTRGIAMFLTAMLPGSPFFRTDPVRLSAVALPTNIISSANQTEFVVKVDRRGVEGEIALALEGLPKGVEATVSPIPAGKKEASVRLKVSDAAKTGKDHTLHIVGTATHDDRIWRQKTQSITLNLTAPESSAAPAAAPQPGK